MKIERVEGRKREGERDKVSSKIMEESEGKEEGIRTEREREE